MGFLSRLLGAGGNDTNPPNLVIAPKWGPDAYSRRMAALSILRGNAYSPANLGPGVRPAPPGSSTEGTKTNAFFPPQQSFKGMAARMTDPNGKTLPKVASFPATKVAVNPVLLAIRPDAGAWANWGGEA